MANVIIKNTSTTVSSEETANVVVSSRNKLYDTAEALKEVVVLRKASDVTPEATTTETTEEPKLLYTTTSEPTFSWQKEETEVQPNYREEDIIANADLSNKTVGELLDEASAKADEFVIVTSEEKKPSLIKSWFTSATSSALNVIVLLMFIAAILIGGKTAFDYVQEAESVKAIASKLESEASSDLPPETRQALATFGPKDTTPDTSSLQGDGFVEILRTKAYYLLARRKDGKIELRTGGSVGWRTNNPGQFGYGDFAKKTGAIAKYSKYAIYPSMDKGIVALETYLFGTNIYRNLTIQDAMKKFYADDKASAEKVARGISVALNVSRYKTKLSSLSNSQRIKMINVVKKNELDLKGVTRIYKDMEDFKRRGF